MIATKPQASTGVRQRSPRAGATGIAPARQPRSMGGEPISVKSLNDLSALLDSWVIDLRSGGRSPATVRSYGDGVRAFLRWAESKGVEPSLDRRTVAAWVVAMQDANQEPTTIRLRHLAVRQFSKWLAAEGEIPTDELAGTKSPKIKEKIVPRLTEEQITSLIKTCKGNGFRDRRDEALIRLMITTGLRAGEATALTLGDIDLQRGEVVIRNGKGGKVRTVPVGPKVIRALDRYVRSRLRHPQARQAALWLGDRGRGPLTYAATYKILKERARAAGIPDFHPHLLRHTWASLWLGEGGSVEAAMRIGGWSHPSMLYRYARADSEQRAADEARRLDIGGRF